MEHKHIALSLLSLVAVISMPMAFAQGSPSLQADLIGTSVIDLADAEKDRVIRAYAQFENFSLDDGSYSIDVIGPNSVVHYDVGVYSTKTGVADFNSMALHIVTDEALEDSENPVVAGAYVMKISTIDGSVSESIPFTILDSRG